MKDGTSTRGQGTNLAILAKSRRAKTPSSLCRRKASHNPVRKIEPLSMEQNSLHITHPITHPLVKKKVEGDNSPGPTPPKNPMD